IDTREVLEVNTWLGDHVSHRRLLLLLVVVWRPGHGTDHCLVCRSARLSGKPPRAGVAGITLVTDRSSSCTAPRRRGGRSWCRTAARPRHRTGTAPGSR